SPNSCFSSDLPSKAIPVTSGHLASLLLYREVTQLLGGGRKMTSIAKKIIATVLATATVLVLAMPMKAMADPWCHHDHGRHLGWYKHHGWEDGDQDDDDDYRPYYSNNYYGYGGPQYQYGYGGGAEGRWERLQARHQQELAMGQYGRAHQT